MQLLLQLTTTLPRFIKKFRKFFFRYQKFCHTWRWFDYNSSETTMNQHLSLGENVLWVLIQCSGKSGDAKPSRSWEKCDSLTKKFQKFPKWQLWRGLDLKPKGQFQKNCHQKSSFTKDYKPTQFHQEIQKKILNVRNSVILGGGLITTPQKPQWTSTCHLVKMCLGCWSSAVESLVTLSLAIPEKIVIL